MLFSITLFVISWTCFFIFGDKKRFWTLTPTCYIAMYCASIFSMITKVFPFWTYPAPTKVQIIIRDLLHDFGVYPIVTYLFLQTIPKQQTFYSIVRHILSWTLVGMAIEWIAVKTGFMKYGLGWNMGWSFFIDIILYLIFYRHHKWREKYIN